MLKQNKLYILNNFLNFYSTLLDIIYGWKFVKPVLFVSYY